jgi:uncharacterized protein YjbI with pentapeptide repeats
MMTGARAACLTTALAAVLVLVDHGVATAQARASCTYSETPPLFPPDQGVVLWSKPQSGSTDPNTVVMSGGRNGFGVGGPCANTVQNPDVILVAPGWALIFVSEHQPSEFILPWGGVNVRATDPLPVIVPPDWRDRWGSTTLVEVRSAGNTLDAFQSCRGCDFAGGRVTFSPLDSSNIVTAFDFSGANFRGATLNGAAPGYDFSGADFRGSTFTAGLNLDGATFARALLPMPLFQQLRGTNVDLSGARVVASAADRSVFAGANLGGVNLPGIQFLGEGLDLTGTKFTGATLTGVSFALARLAGADLSNASGAGASFHGADLSSAVLGGPQANWQGADFTNAIVSGASFAGANLGDADFTGALGVGTDFSLVTAPTVRFPGAHLFGGLNFADAKDLTNIDFAGAVLVGSVGEDTRFRLKTLLSGARFDGAVCVNCDLDGATLDGATFVGTYLPGVILSKATNLTNASFARAWLYCGGPTNPKCSQVPRSQPPLWNWTLALGSGEEQSPVPFPAIDLSEADFNAVTACPDGNEPAGSSCQGHLLPDSSEGPPPPIPAPCSAAARGSCPTTTFTLFESDPAKPLAIVPATPPTWNTTLLTQGYYVAFSDGTVRLVSGGVATIVAGTPGMTCSGAASPCGDGGPAVAALLGRPTGLTVDLDGSLYIADPSPVLRVRAINPSGIITTVAGTGLQCPAIPCSEGVPATSAALYAANGVWVDPHGVLLIADGVAGVRRVATDGTITTLPGTAVTYNVVSVVGSAAGPVYAATRSADLIIRIDPSTGGVTPVVGTGVSGYNGNKNPFNNSPLSGTQVQVNQPLGLAVDLDGNVLFADSANHLIRAFVPSQNQVIDDLAGQIVNGIPQGGFNGDGHWATDTQLNVPLGVAATRSALIVIADTENMRVRQAGPRPANTLGEGPPEVVIACRSGQTWSCRRLATPPGPAVTETSGAVTISQNGMVFATGRSFLPVPGRLRLQVTEHRPLVPGRYDLIIVQGGQPQTQTIWIDQAPDVVEMPRR